MSSSLDARQRRDSNPKILTLTLALALILTLALTLALERRVTNRRTTIRQGQNKVRTRQRERRDQTSFVGPGGYPIAMKRLLRSSWAIAIFDISVQWYRCSFVCLVLSCLVLWLSCLLFSSLVSFCLSLSCRLVLSYRAVALSTFFFSFSSFLVFPFFVLGASIND